MKISASSKVHVFKFSRFIFRGSYFRVLVVGRENRENLDLAKISRYTVLVSVIIVNYLYLFFFYVLAYYLVFIHAFVSGHILCTSYIVPSYLCCPCIQLLMYNANFHTKKSRQ